MVLISGWSAVVVGLGGGQLWPFFKNTLREILANSESRSIFLFLVINLAFMGVEVAYGYWTNSLVRRHAPRATPTPTLTHSLAWAGRNGAGWCRV
jgi:hypothetical protein